MNVFVKDPDASLDYSVDWAGCGYLDVANNEQIFSSLWVVEPDVSPIDLVVDYFTNDATTTTVKVHGGTPGARYALTNRITTTLAREDDRSIVIRIENK